MSDSDAKNQDEEPSIEEILASIRQIISDDEDEDDSSKGEKEAPTVEAEVPEADSKPEAKPEKKPAPEQAKPSTKQEEKDIPLEPIAPEVQAEPAQQNDEDEDDDDILDLNEIVEDNNDKTDNDMDSASDASDKIMPDQDDDIFGTGAYDGMIDFDEDDKDTSIDMTEDDDDDGQDKDVFDSLPDEEILSVDSFEENAEDAFSVLTNETVGAVEQSISKLAASIQISNRPGNTLEDMVQQILRPMLRDWLDTNLPPMIEQLVQDELEKIIKKTMRR